jgi:ABC-type dipeptide/oligopeptide/nickel transport system permease subunit
VPWAPVPPVIAISTLVVSLNLIADGLRQAGWVD